MLKQEMIIEKVSPFSLNETVEVICNNAKQIGWTIPQIKELEKMISKNGGPEVLPVRLVELCQPFHAAKMVGEDDSRLASVLMPCTISVYLKHDEKVYVSFLNPSLAGQMFGGIIAEVMSEHVASDQAKILEFLL